MIYMMDYIKSLNPVMQALLATLFTYGITALGAAFVFIGKELSRKMLDGILAFAGGVMIAASFWSLLAPAIEMSEGKALPAFLPPTIGFLAGAMFLWLIDKIIPHLHVNFGEEHVEGVKTSWQRYSYRYWRCSFQCRNKYN
mgnify:CR=1 FL=1